MKTGERTRHLVKGFMALSPLAVFLVVYLVSSLLCGDFYKIPVSSAFLLASFWAILTTRGLSFEKRVEAFSAGAGDRNVLLMIWIFILAGAFASTAKSIGAIDAVVNLTLNLLPGRFLLAGLFMAACFVSMSIGTSVGTRVSLVPIAAGISEHIGLSNALITASVVGGAFFGDNLSFISDTTIAATRTQGCSMKDKFKVNFSIVLPAALLVALLYIWLGSDVSLPETRYDVNIFLLLPYILVIALSLSGLNVTAVLALGIAFNALTGWLGGYQNWTEWLGTIGEGIAGMGDLIIVTLLAGGMLELIRINGGIDFIVNGLTRRIRGRRAASFCIAGLVSFVNLCTANNTIAIITTGRIAHDITRRFGLDPRKTASILDTFSCLVQGLIPYGAQMLMACSLSGADALGIIGHLYYPMVLGVFALLAIAFRYPRQYS